ncbi:MAG TPA: permease-like cell division protein FtsX [Candidatus Kapabacteria bacterium]|nr:permease-like cell division protein FtsX [Candidatus Kapabacteria bacterium]
MHIGYLVREGVSGIRRTPVASTVTLLTIVAALVLAGLFTYTTMNFDSFISSMRQRVELEAFLLPIPDQQTNLLKGQILGVPGVDSVHFISQQEAAQIFEAQTGERVTALLDSNPLPSSFRIALRPGFNSAKNVGQIVQSVQQLGGVDTVLYRQEYVNQIDEIAATTRTIGWIGGGIIMLIAIVLTTNTIRLAIFSKRNVVQTLHLVGATMTFIRIPFLLEGIVHGIAASALAIGVLGVLIHFVGASIFPIQLLTPPLWFYFTIAGLGVALGLFGSIIAVLRFLKLATAR